VSPEELRRAALEALGEHGDERAREVLRRATLVVGGERASAPLWRRSVPRPAPWEGSSVTLAVDAGTLGMLRTTPAVVDALNVAFAAAIALEPGRRLVDFALRWSTGRPVTPTAYRDAPPTAAEATLRGSLLDYLDGAGDRTLAASLTACEIAVENASEVFVTLPKGEDDTLRADAYAMARLTAAVRDLLGRGDAHVRVRRPKHSL
jgi:hypothetical protein